MGFIVSSPLGVINPSICSNEYSLYSGTMFFKIGDRNSLLVNNFLNSLSYVNFEFLILLFFEVHSMFWKVLNAKVILIHEDGITFSIQLFHDMVVYVVSLEFLLTGFVSALSKRPIGLTSSPILHLLLLNSSQNILPPSKSVVNTNTNR